MNIMGIFLLKYLQSEIFSLIFLQLLSMQGSLPPSECDESNVNQRPTDDTMVEEGGLQS
jgi:hypothetical protein